MEGLVLGTRGGKGSRVLLEVVEDDGFATLAVLIRAIGYL